jgi:hypothetical protein
MKTYIPFFSAHKLKDNLKKLLMDPTYPMGRTEYTLRNKCGYQISRNHLLLVIMQMGGRGFKFTNSAGSGQGWTLRCP